MFTPVPNRSVVVTDAMWAFVLAFFREALAGDAPAPIPEGLHAA